MATAALFAQGTKLRVNTIAAPTVFTAVAEVTNINPPSPTVAVIDVTSHDSTGGTPAQQIHESIPGLVDPGQMTFDFNNLPANATQDKSADGLYGLLLSRAVRDWQVVYPSINLGVQARGYLTSLAFTAPHDGKLGGVGTIKLTGPIIFPTLP